MQAIILAGGKGRRLEPYTTVLPKPLMPIGDHPILDIILRQLKRAGINEIILAVGHMSHLFQAFFQDGSRYGLTINYSFEKEALGTAGPIALAMDQLEEDFLVMNGDLLTNIHYANLYLYHKGKQAAATIAMFRRQVKIDFGVLEMDGDNKLVRYIEKPTYDFAVSMGVNVLHKSAIEPYLEYGKYLDIPDLLMSMQKEGLPVHCYSEDCHWLDIGRIDDYHLANEIFEAKRGEFLQDEI